MTLAASLLLLAETLRSVFGMGRWVLCLLGGGEGVRAEMDCEAALGWWEG